MTRVLSESTWTSEGRGVARRVYMHGLSARGFRKRGLESGKENEECDLFGICEGKGKTGRI